MKLHRFSFKKIQLFIKKFEIAENTIEAVIYLDQIILMLEQTGDERVNNFLNKIKEELNFSPGQNWKKMEIYFPELDCSHSINRYLFIEDELKKKNLNNETPRSLLQKRIISTFDHYEVMFGQMVPLYVVAS